MKDIRLFNRPMQEIRSKAWSNVDLVRKADLPVNTDHLYAQAAYKHAKTASNGALSKIGRNPLPSGGGQGLFSSAVIFLSATWILREKINGCRFST